MDIKFGTDGWRGVIDDDFNQVNVLRVAHALDAHLKSRAKQVAKVVVGFDCRSQSKESAQLFACSLAKGGHKVQLAKAPVPSPAVSLQTKNAKLDVGVMITASHNPPNYNGIKFKGPYGGSFTPELIAALEPHLPRSIDQADIGSIVSDHLKAVEHIDLIDIHTQALLDFVGDVNLSPLRIVVDPMHGSGAKVLPEVLRRLGAEVTTIRDESDPTFDGMNPEPLERTTKKLEQAIVARRAHVGFCMDGDADRISARDDRGSFVDSHRMFCLLLRYLVEHQGRHGLVVKTQTTTSMVQKLCDKLRQDCVVTPVGFKHICKLMLERDVLIGGEESGGIGIKAYLPERDASLCAVLLADHLVKSGTLNLSEHIDKLFELVGRHEYVRLDWHIEGDAKKIVSQLVNHPPKTIGERLVKDVDTLDGIKLLLEDSWVMLRASGTEPLIRIYAEAPSKVLAEKLTHEVKALV